MIRYDPPWEPPPPRGDILQDYPAGITMSRRISSKRKSLYYLGNVLIVVGMILFASTFVTFLSHFGDVSNFEADARLDFGRALAGMACMIVGGILRRVGARGLAGSGIVLDPDRAREELEPYSRMVGGMAKDALDEADIDLDHSCSRSPERVVMIKCRACGKLNEEDSKFCQECGQAL